jgi:hypothetical protein
MGHHSIGYHTRLFGNHSVKCVGGSFGGSLDLETANRLVKAHFTVTVKPSGTPVFVDREGREVRLYISVDPAMTDAGKLALETYAKLKRARQEQDAREEARKRDQIDSLLDGMTLDEALRRLETAREELG